MQTADQLAAAIDTIVDDFRDRYGNLPAPQHVHLYEADDGRCVLVSLSPTEAHAVESALFGQQVADDNYALLQSDAFIHGGVTG